MELPSLLKQGRNCWRIEKASRVAFLVDAAAYYAAFADAVLSARQSILIVGWDMDSHTRLFRDDAPREWPVEAGDFLNAAVSRRRGLHAHMLDWDFNIIFAFEREALPVINWDWSTHRRLHFLLDGHHPLWGAHHQKVVVIDDGIAFAGGLDLTRSRWDTPEHRVPDPRRENHGGELYPPFHDVMMAVDGAAAAALGDLVRERWRRATGKRLRRPERGESDPWPSRLVPEMRDVEVGIARTMPAWNGEPGVREAERLLFDAIESARRLIFIESQYLTSGSIGRALAARLADEHGPEVIVVLPKHSSGGFEEATMGILRGRVLRALRESDRHGRLGIYYPVPDGMPGGTVNVHSKVLVVDDDLVRIGSSNLTNRSLGLDTECDLAVEARGREEARAAIAGLRCRLLGEHLGVPGERVAEAAAAGGSLIEAIEALRGPGRTLSPLDGDVPEWQDRLIPESGLVDWEQPMAPEEIIRDIIPEDARESTPHGVLRGVVILAALLAMAAAWALTPLRERLSLAVVVKGAEAVRELPGSPLLVIAAYVAAGLAVIPVTLLIVATAFVFGPLQGFVYSVLGSLASASVAFAVGRRLGRRTLRLMGGRRLRRLIRMLRRRGLLAVAMVRMIPIAPFTVVNMVAGAFRLRYGDFALGTLLGMAPGILLVTVFGERLSHAVRHPGIASFAVLVLYVAAVAAAALWTGRRLESGHGRPADGGPGGRGDG